MKDAIIKLFNGEEKIRAKEIKSIVSDFVFNLPPNRLSGSFICLAASSISSKLLGARPVLFAPASFKVK